MKKVSVIIPTYNRAELVQRAVQSVLSQTYQNFEILVVDDGSTDNTAELLTGMERVRYLKIEHSGLPARVRNEGIRASQGEVIAFLDSDDLWLPEKLEKQVMVLETKKEIDLVCSNALVVHEKEGEGKKYFTELTTLSGNLLEKLLTENIVICSSVVCWRALLEKIGLFSEEKILRTVEDYDLWLRAAAISELCYLAEPLVIYLDVPAESIRGGLQPSRYWQGMLKILKNIHAFCSDRKDCHQFPNALVKRLKFQYLWKLSRAKWNEGEKKESVEETVKLIIMYPLRSAHWILNKAGSAFSYPNPDRDAEE